MQTDFLFFLNATFFGIGLAMDAFSVSLANGLNEPHMRRAKIAGIAGVFAGFQILMPLLGWLCIHTIATVFTAFQVCIPFIALGLLGYIGGDMLIKGIRGGEEGAPAVGFRALIVQGVATSIDALSVGFTIADYPFPNALTESLIIGLVTFFICVGGLLIGRRFGTKLAGRASVLGGVILIAIGLEIFITSFFG